MNRVEVVNLIAAGLFSLIALTGLSFRENPEREFMRYRPLADPFLMVDILLFFPLFLWIRGDNGRQIVQQLGSRMLGILALLTLYYAILLLLFPLLRKYIRAAGIAMLWIVPAELCYVDSYRSRANLSLPRRVIPLGNLNISLLAKIWFAGFGLVLLGAVVSHLIFRRRILKNSGPAPEEVQKLWTEMQTDMGLERPRSRYRLVVSDAVSSPLSVGIYRRSMRVVLPARVYQTEELELILRHELIHILHQDSRTKFFMSFCTALCWFNPLMWLSMRKCSDDMELSCDEMVLAENEEQRSRYAELILSSAGDDRGFTTCLSARAESLKYRLQNILHPGKKYSGYLTIFLCLFLFLFFLFGLEFSYGQGSLAELDRDGWYCPECMDAEYILILEEDSHQLPKSYTCRDADALLNYLSGLELSRLPGRRYYAEGDTIVLRMLDSQPDGKIRMYSINLKENCISLCDYSDILYGSYYYVPQGVDLEYIRSLLVLKQ